MEHQLAKQFDYPCVTVEQSSGGKKILLFSASATDIDSWVGIPQRLSLSGTETAGFQRTVSSAREAALRKFFAEPSNVIQNPLLCAIRQAPGIKVSFSPDAQDSRLGLVRIELDDFEGMTLQQLLHAARTYLESRVTMLAGRQLPTELIVELEGEINAGAQSETAKTDDEDSGEEESVLDEPAEDALFDESQISNFWDHLRAREEIAQKLGADTPEKLAGFSREMLISYLRPIILVDGQHRLRGAILAAKDQANTSSQGEEMVVNGAAPADAVTTVASQIARSPSDLPADGRFARRACFSIRAGKPEGDAGSQGTAWHDHLDKPRRRRTLDDRGAPRGCEDTPRGSAHHLDTLTRRGQPIRRPNREGFRVGRQH